MLEPKPTTITGQDGKDRTFILTKFPAVEGREIIVKYPTANIPKIGDYGLSEETMLKLMAYVFVDVGGTSIPLTTKALVNNHVGDWFTLATLEFRQLEYNCAFFGKGLNSDFFASISPKVQAWTSRISTVLSGLSSPAGEQP